MSGVSNTNAIEKKGNASFEKMEKTFANEHEASVIKDPLTGKERKITAMTKAEYDALEVKDINTFYFIEEEV